VQNQLPTFVLGDRITGQTDGRVLIEGQESSAELRRHGTVIRANQLEFDPNNNTANAVGQVLINRNGNRFEGTELHINVDTGQGTFEQPAFSLLGNGGQGDASRIDFLSEDRMAVHDARYSTCPRTPGQTWMPAWLLRAKRIDLDSADESGVAAGGVLEFQGVPILGAPYLSFPLTDKRKSGVLPPTINIDNISGLELTLPYYLNIAPNVDATLYPTYMSKRGVDLGGELRYLEPTYHGEVRAAFASGWMRVRGARRRRGVDAGFTLSDHVDWPQLLSAIDATGAERVWVTHGFTGPVVRWLTERGLDARAIATRWEGERDDAAVDATDADAASDGAVVDDVAPGDLP
jgi:LPS-assembly protein